MKLFRTERSGPPAGLKAGRICTPDGVVLRHAVARPEKGPVRGTVVLLQGRADFIERYYETMEELLARGYAVATMDWRGQGLSSRSTRNRLKGHVDSFRQYETDLETFMRQVVLPECPPPLFALAHSMGGHILLHAGYRHIWFTRAMVLSPMIEIRRRRLPRAVWRLAAMLATYAGFGRMFVPGQRRKPLTEEDFPENLLTADFERFSREVEMAREHPQLCVAGPTMGWLNAALASSDRLRRHAEARDVPLWPVLAVCAGDDRLVDTEATRSFARDVAGMACIVIRGARHELLMERDVHREQVWAAFDSFISGEEVPVPGAGKVEETAASRLTEARPAEAASG
jgi:lysophospholipase